MTCFPSDSEWRILLNTDQSQEQCKIYWRGNNGKSGPRLLHFDLFCFARLVKPLLCYPLVISRPVYPKCQSTFTWWEIGLLTYAFVCVLKLMESTTIYIFYTIIVMSLLRQATEVWKIKMLWHPHGYSWNTHSRDRLFQHVVSGWKANTKKMWFCSTQDRMCRLVRIDTRDTERQKVGNT